MAAIDLKTIIFRAFDQGEEVNTPSQFPTAGTSTVIVSLAAIKFRSKEIGDDED